MVKRSTREEPDIVEAERGNKRAMVEQALVPYIPPEEPVPDGSSDIPIGALVPYVPPEVMREEDMELVFPFFRRFTRRQRYRKYWYYKSGRSFIY